MWIADLNFGCRRWRSCSTSVCGRSIESDVTPCFHTVEDADTREYLITVITISHSCEKCYVRELPAKPCIGRYLPSRPMAYRTCLIANEMAHVEWRPPANRLAS